MSARVLSLPFGRPTWPRPIVAVLAGAVLACGITGWACRGRQPRLTARSQALQRVFSAGGMFAEDSMYACLADALAQGIAYQQALKICETKLLESGLKEFGKAPDDPLALPPGWRGTKRPFDPASVTANCRAGDAGINAGPGSGEADYVDKDGLNWGKYSWSPGGKTEPESRAAKKEAVDKANLLNAVADKVTDAANAANDAVVKGKVPVGAQTVVNAAAAAKAAANKAANDATADAKKDPNASKTPSPGSSSSPGGSSSPSSSPGSSAGPGPSASAGSPGSGGSAAPKSGTQDSECQQALQQAREFLYECNRNGWKSYDCQQLQARMNNCPDPALILVDPDQGYTCGAKPDPLGVLVAWHDKCQQLRRGVDGQDPCGLPRLDRDGRQLAEGRWDICDDPRVYIDPESGACAGTLTLPDVGPNMSQIVVFGLKKLGGPVFVLPKDPKPDQWSPRPEPRPTPH